MQFFILTYDNGGVRINDFFDIRRTIDARGPPKSIRCVMNNDDTLDAFQQFEVDLTTGRFTANGQIICPASDRGVLLTDRPVEYRPVWFRRQYRSISMTGANIASSHAIFLGWQYTEKGRNHKRMIQVHQDGTVGVG